jgi:hypothetical protein
VKRANAGVTRRQILVWTGTAIASARLLPAFATSSVAVQSQPYFASVNRALEALKRLGAPIAVADAQQIAVLAQQNDATAVEAAERLLDHYTLVNFSLAPDAPSLVTAGGAPRVLVEQGWRAFLVRIVNPDGRTDNLAFSTGLATPGKMWPFGGIPNVAQRAYLLDTLNKGPLLEKMWLLSEMYETTTSVIRYNLEIPVAALSGASVEYRVVQLFSRDHGTRRADVALYTFPSATNGFGPSGSRKLDFDCKPSRTVALSVLETDGRGCVASLTIRDKLDHIYPPQMMRLAPDMTFQRHIYRADGESVRLPDGQYTLESKRGPEYLRGTQTVTIAEGSARIEVKLRRWIDPAKWGWYSGDTHIHAAGCAHYEIPTEGVSPETMIRHVRGEALSIGDVLTWGGSWYYQKQFFEGRAASPEALLEHPDLQRANRTTLEPRTTPKDSESLLRYDVEVSGFPSSLSGHLVLLRLEEQDYPGTKLIEDWPSWNLPILKWAREQGAVAGYAHCSGGMGVDSIELPNYEIPPMDSIGANEAIVDVTHGYADFLSGCNGAPIAELNVWYHMLNCGYRLPMIGETDYPCFAPTADARPGLGRSYVHLDQRPTNDAGYDAWVRNLQKGRLYYGDGRSHFLVFAVNGSSSGQEDVTLATPATVSIAATVAARLEPAATPESLNEAADEPWHIEHARIGKSQEVPVELVINGVAGERVSILADGTPRPIHFKARVARSSWIALRVLASGHTYPVFVQVAGKPIRASRRSAEWLRKCVDALWDEKHRLMRETERPAAAEAYDHARRTYDRIIAESDMA